MRGMRISCRAVRDSDLPILLPTIIPFSATLFNRAHLVGKHDDYLKELFKLRMEYRSSGIIAFDESTQQFVGCNLSTEWERDRICTEEIMDLASNYLSGPELEFYVAACQFDSSMYDQTPDYMKTGKTLVGRHGWIESEYRGMNIYAQLAVHSMIWGKQNGFDYLIVNSYKSFAQKIPALGWIQLAEMPLSDFKMYDRIKHLAEDKELHYEKVNRLYGVSLKDFNPNLSVFSKL